MNHAKTNTPDGCGGTCSRCEQGTEVRNGPSGWRLTLPAAGALLGPLLTAAAAATLAPPGRRGAWAVGGLAAGLVAAILIGRCLLRGHPERGPRSPAGKEPPCQS